MKKINIPSLCFLCTTILSLAVLGFMAQTSMSDQSYMGRSDLQNAPQALATLFFADMDYNGFHVEYREVSELTSSILINKLIDGPQSANGARTIPQGTELLDTWMDNGTVFLNFNAAFVDKHWGGSTGETYTLFSIVHTLSENISTIDGVQIMVCGEKISTLAGHYDLNDPIIFER